MKTAASETQIDGLGVAERSRREPDPEQTAEQQARSSRTPR